MTTTADPLVQRPGRPARPARPAGRRPRRWTSLRVLLPLVLLLAAAAGTYRFVVPHGPVAYIVPQSPQFEARWGVRFNQVDVLGDGGLVEVGYTVIDVEKAIQFQSDVAHPPLVHSDDGDGTADTTSQMRPGHNLRAGTDFFLLYSNPHSAIRAGGTVSIEFKGSWLRHVPVR